MCVVVLTNKSIVAVLDSGPPDLRHGHHLVPSEFFCESSVDALVEENSHEALASMRALASSRKAIT